MKPTLLVLAAGMGSRYGGLKQIDPVGPSGEVVLDYSVNDALASGFGRVVFVIRRDFEEEFRRVVVSRYEGKGYADFKRDLADAVATFLTEYQKKYNAISDESALKVLEQGRQFVSEIAKKKMEEVKKKVGFLG